MVLRAIPLDTELQLLDGGVDMIDRISLVAVEIGGRIASKCLLRVLKLFDCLMHNWEVFLPLPIELTRRLGE